MYSVEESTTSVKLLRTVTDLGKVRFSVWFLYFLKFFVIGFDDAIYRR
jgi:hypothetical protein